MTTSTMTTPFLARIEEARKTTGDAAWLTSIRAAGLSRFENDGLPTTKIEDWKYTGFKELEKVSFHPHAGSIDAGALAAFAVPGLDAYQLVFVDGAFDAALSSVDGLPAGATITSMREAVADANLAAHVERHAGKHATEEMTAFVALNAATFTDGAFVHLAKGTVLDKPLKVTIVTTGADRPADVQLRNLYVAEANAQATIIEDYVSVAPADHVYFANPVTEVALDENAHLDHYRLVREGDAAYHVSFLGTHQVRGSNFTGNALCLGGKLVRNNVNTMIDDEGCETTLNGLTLGTGAQHVDNQTRIVHAKPHCHSYERYRAILDDESEGVFNGKIYVARDAQKTDAEQSNDALLLSKSATMNAKPELEIYADDVKCTHGATVGNLEDTSLFYMRARGIDKREAERLLTLAFAGDVLTHFRQDAVRELAADLLRKRLV